MLSSWLWLSFARIVSAQKYQWFNSRKKTSRIRQTNRFHNNCILYIAHWLYIPIWNVVDYLPWLIVGFRLKHINTHAMCVLIRLNTDIWPNPLKTGHIKNNNNVMNSEQGIIRNPVPVYSMVLKKKKNLNYIMTQLTEYRFFCVCVRSYCGSIPFWMVNGCLVYLIRKGIYTNKHNKLHTLSYDIILCCKIARSLLSLEDFSTLNGTNSVRMCGNWM